MRFAKKLLALMLVAVLALGTLSGYEADAKELTIATPKVTVKMIKKNLGFKVTIGKTKDADGYVVEVTGKAVANSECRNSVLVNGYLKSTDNIYVSQTIDKNGKSKRSVTINTLPEGTYTVKVKSYNNKKYGTLTYSAYSKEKTVKIKTPTAGYSSSYDFSKVKKGDVVKFGSYEQDMNYANGKEPIEWIVLEKTKKSILLLSKYALDRLPYNLNWENVTWETCTLRKWLNKDFISAAFNNTEQGMIKTTTVENYDNAVYKTAGGNDTKDKVFLLSQLEMINSDYGFSEEYYEADENRVCTLAWNKERSCWWWLRSPGVDALAAAGVGGTGDVDSGGGNVNYGDYDGPACVRPALYINL